MQSAFRLYTNYGEITMKEIWKPVKKFEDYYEISNTGKIRNLKTKKQLKNRKNNRGYYIADLYRNKEKHTTLVHRLIAEAFLVNTGINPNGTKMKGKCQINHKDGNKNNNSIENLEWCDQSYNLQEAYRLGLKKYSAHEISEAYREKMKKISSRPSPGKEIMMIDIKSNKIIQIFESSMDAVRKLPEINLKDSSIRDAANHRHNLQTYKGYRWEFTGNISNSSRKNKE